MSIIWISREKALQGTTHSMGLLFAQSILSEYDLMLYDKYKIFGFYGDAFYTQKRLEYYFNKSIGAKEYADIYVDNINLKEYSLTKLENFHHQIGEIVLADLAENTPREANVSSYLGNIKNKRIIEELPSRSVDNFGGAVQPYFNQNIDVTPVDHINSHLYINKYCKNLKDSKMLGETFFSYEMEYIVGGKYSDVQNLDVVRRQIYTMRVGANMAYIVTDKEKVALASAMAVATGGTGPQVALVKYSILFGWASAEATADLNTIMNNGKVPVFKSSHTWGRGMSCQEGLTYSEYLNILLNFISLDVKTLRLMDIIQLNMILTYDREFLLSDYYVGIEYESEINGKKVHNKKVY